MLNYSAPRSGFYKQHACHACRYTLTLQATKDYNVAADVRTLAASSRKRPSISYRSGGEYFALVGISIGIRRVTVNFVSHQVQLTEELFQMRRSALLMPCQLHMKCPHNLKVRASKTGYANSCVDLDCAFDLKQVARTLSNHA